MDVDRNGTQEEDRSSLDYDNQNKLISKAEDTLAAELARQSTLRMDVYALIVAARQRAGFYVNQELTLLYWDVGRRIRREVLREQRADYGEQVVQALSQNLVVEFGRGFGRAKMSENRTRRHR